MPRFELGVGYNYIHVDDGIVDDLHGFNLSAFVNIRSWVSLGGEFMGGYGKAHRRFSYPGLIASTSEDRYVYVFGPRFGFEPFNRVRLFGQVLLGGSTAYAEAHYTSPFYNRHADAGAFTTTIGGGVDWKLTHLLTWRIVEADYMRFHFSGGSENDLQFSTSLVFTFGE